MSTLYVWAVDRELCDGSPVIHIKIDGLSGPRKRKLSMDELAEICNTRRPWTTRPTAALCGS